MLDELGPMRGIVFSAGLTPNGRWSCFLTMKRILQITILLGIVLSLNSCSLPSALMRSAGNLVNTADSMVGSMVSGS